MNRRGFLHLGMKGILVACVAPAFVKAASLMPGRALYEPLYYKVTERFSGGVTDYRVWEHRNDGDLWLSEKALEDVIIELDRVKQATGLQLAIKPTRYYIAHPDGVLLGSAVL